MLPVRSSWIVLSRNHAAESGTLKSYVGVLQLLCYQWKIGRKLRAVEFEVEATRPLADVR